MRQSLLVLKPVFALFFQGYPSLELPIAQLSAPSLVVGERPKSLQNYALSLVLRPQFQFLKEHHALVLMNFLHRHGVSRTVRLLQWR